MRATGTSMRNARRMRHDLSPPEAKLWVLLRGSPSGVRFRRQYPVGPYVADFYCASAKLVIEVDGLIRDSTDAQIRDSSRDLYLRNLGLRVVRIAAAEVLANASAVADGLIQLCLGGIGPSTTQLR